jgi:hypothetical protein
MRKRLVTLVGAVFVAGLLAFLATADARRGGFHGGFHGGFRGGGHAFRPAYAGGAYRGHVNRNFNANRNINRNVTRNVNRTVNRQYVYRNGRRGYWRNGVWIAVPAVAGATYGYVASCAYEYRRWQNTGSAYWRDRYYQCAQ